jgi:cell division protein FtsX
MGIGRGYPLLKEFFMTVGSGGVAGAVGAVAVLGVAAEPASPAVRSALAATGIGVGVYLAVALALLVVGFVLSRLGARRGTSLR